MAEQPIFSMQINIGGHSGSGFFSQMESYMHKEFLKAQEDIKQRLLRSARENHQYKHRTRNLRNATKVKGQLVHEKGLELYVDLRKADYGEYIITGHGSWDPDPFINKAVEDNERWINERISKAVNDAVIAFNRLK